MNSETSWAKEIISCSSCHIRDPVRGGDVRKIGASEGDLDEGKDEGCAAEAHIALTPPLALRHSLPEQNCSVIPTAARRCPPA